MLVKELNRATPYAEDWEIEEATVLPFPAKEKEPPKLHKINRSPKYILVEYQKNKDQKTYWQGRQWTTIRAEAKQFDSVGKIFAIMEYMGFIGYENDSIIYYPLEV